MERPSGEQNVRLWTILSWSQIVFGALSVLATAMSAISLWGYLKGPEIYMLAPSEITLFSNYCMDDEDKGYQFVEFIVPVALINTGHNDQNDILINRGTKHQRMVLTIREKPLAREQLSLDSNQYPIYQLDGLNGRRIQYYAYEYVQTADNGKRLKGFPCENRAGYEFPEIDIKPLQTGKAGVVINGASAFGREVHFVTDQYLCDAYGENCIEQRQNTEHVLTFEEFINTATENMQLQFDFYATFYFSGDKKSSCILYLHRDTLESFKNNYVATTTCDPRSSIRLNGPGTEGRSVPVGYPPPIMY